MRLRNLQRIPKWDRKKNLSFSWKWNIVRRCHCVLIAFSRRPRRCYGALTAFCRDPTWSSCWRLPAISRRFHRVHCDLTALPPRLLRSHGPLRALLETLRCCYDDRTALLSEHRGTVFVVCMLKTNAVPRRSMRSHRAPTALLAMVLRSPRRSTLFRAPP